MPPLFKNSRCKPLLVFLSLVLHFIIHIRISEADATIDTMTLTTSEGTFMSAVTAGSLTGSSAGDFNGDGFEDIILGTPKVSSNSGLVYVIFGTATGIPTNIDLNTLTIAQGITILPPGSSAQLGFSVSALGDINGDSVDDIIIGAYWYAKAYVIFGKHTGVFSNIDLSITDISATGKGIVISGLTQLGYQVSSAGDFNHDGINDFMVSTPFAFSNQGVVYVIFGKSTIATSFNFNTFTLPPSQGIQILGQAGSQLGYSLSRAGDFNHDGIDDIMMGANTPGGGMVVILYGTSTPSSITDVSTIPAPLTKGVVITGTSSYTIGARNSISSVGDLNNDGIDDVAIGVNTYLTNVGATFVVYGKSGGFSANIALPSSYNGIKITGASSVVGSFGTAVTSADINGDGLSDLIVGASSATAPAGSTAGMVYVLFGNLNGFPSLIDLTNAGTAQLPQVLKIYGDVTTAQLGLDLSFAKDLNNDGVNDLVILGNAKAYIIYGTECTSITQCTYSMPPICYASEGCTCSLDLSQFFQANQCVGACVNGYYSTTQNCEACPASCLSCTSPSNCQTCTSGITPQAGSCDHCSGATYFDVTSSACKNCPTYCATCTSSSNCQTCNEGYTLSGTTCEGAISQTLVGAATALGNAKVAASTATLAVTILAFSNPGPIVILSLSEVFLALRLMKINYPPRLEYLIGNSGSQDTIFDKLTTPPGKLVDHITKYPLPEKFEDVGFHSSFLVNFWPSLITLTGVIALVLLSIFLSSCVIASRMNPHTRTKKIARWLHSKFKQAVKWNLFISTLTGCFGDMGMFTALEMKTLHFDSVLEGVSFSVCLLMNIIGIFIQIVSINVTWKLRKAHAQSRQKKDQHIVHKAKERFGDYEVIFEGFKENTFLQQNFLFFFNFKMYIFFAVISYFPDSPVVPTLVNTIIGLFVLLYVALIRPHKEKIDFVIFIILEIIYEIMNICTLLLALDETYDWNFDHTRITLGDIIIMSNCAFMIMVSIILLIQIFKLFKDIFNLIKRLLIKQRNLSYTKSFNSIERSSLRSSNTEKNTAHSQQQPKNSIGLESNLNHFERSLKRQRAKNALAIMQNLDDSEIAQIQHDNMDHRNNDSQVQRIQGIRFLRKPNNDFYEDRQRRQGNQDRVEEIYSNEKDHDQDQSFHAPARLIPAKRLKTYRLERPNN